MEPSAVNVRWSQVTVRIYPWTHPSGRSYWRFDWRDEQGRRRSTTKADLPQAKLAALARAKIVQSGSVNLSKLTPVVLQRVSRLLAADPDLAHCSEYLAWLEMAYPKKELGEAVAEFLAAKVSNRGRSNSNVETLRKVLNAFSAVFGPRLLSDVSATELDAFIARTAHSARTRRNERNALITFFRWCRQRSLLPDRATAADRTEKPMVTRAIPATWSPVELSTLLTNAAPRYVPWLACAAFGGLRNEELWPPSSGTKSPLDWSDFQWDRSLLIVRPETAKTKTRRVVPILPALAAWLEPHRKTAGPVCAGLPPQDPPPRGGIAETKRLGALVGGWRRNALRHSFISYRAALVGLAQTAMEAGNSESEAKRSYNDAKGADEAAEWFAVLPPA